MLELVEHDGVAIGVTFGGTELCRYVYVPDLPQAESPQPYLHPVRTLAGDVITLHRPWDHPWHKGISLALPNVADANFWGGSMQILRANGEIEYAMNNGTQAHDGFEHIGAEGDVARIDQRLIWSTEHGEQWITEARSIEVRVGSDEDAWTLSFRTSLRNRRGTGIEFGSPTTNGRPNAGYGGLFWRGTRELGNGTILASDEAGGPEMMGRRARWLAYSGRHDGSHRFSTVVFVDNSQNLRHPTQWFVRSEPYACLCPAPFFDRTYDLADGATLTLRYDLVIGAGVWDHDRIDRFAADLG